MRVKIVAPLDDYREVRFFRRGHHRETIEIPQWFGWRKRESEIEVYDDVVLLVDDEGSRCRRSEASADARARSSSGPARCCSKYFRNIARADLNALFPDVRVVMSLRDRL